MDRGTPITAHNRLSDHSSDWISICAELQTRLPAEIVEIEGQRLRIEAVIAKLDIGDVVRHLCIQVFTPGHKNIVRYELDTPPSETVTSQLAAIISGAKDRKEPAEGVIPRIHDCLQKAGPYFFKTLAPEKNPYLLAPMKREIPDFEMFAKNPLSMDSAFSVDREVNGERIRAVATVRPERRYTLLEASSYPSDGTPIPPALKFKVRCPATFWERPRSEEETMAALHSATFEAMHILTSLGTAQASSILRDPDIDSRLQQGIVTPATCDVVHTMPSGARVLLEEGDSLACVRIECSGSEQSAAFFWRIAASQGLLSEDDPRLITARSAVQSLIEGDWSRRGAAIKTLNRLVNGASNNLPETSWTPPYYVPSFSELTEHDLFGAVRHLSRSTVRVVNPSSDLLILDLLQGFRSIKLEFKDPGHSRRTPQDPDTLFFGFRDDGALKVAVTSPFNNYLETVIPPSYFRKHEALEEAVRRLASLFDRQTDHGFMELRAEMERLAQYSKGAVSASCKIFRDIRNRFPAISNMELNKALDTAAELALVYEADVTHASLSEIKMFLNNPTYCEMVVGKNFTIPAAMMHLHVRESGVQRIELTTPFGNRYPFTFATPLALPEGREIITKLFTMVQSLPSYTEAPRQGPHDPICSTALFAYLRECEGRFASK
jgi:hypothetical protein